MSPLRWWLLILGVVFFSALSVWELRRPRQARRADLPPEATRSREPALQLPEMHAHESLTSRALPVVELPEDADELPEDADELPVLEAAASGGDGAAPGAQEIEAMEEGAELDEAPTEAAEAQAEARFEVASAAVAAEATGASEPFVDWPPDAQRRVVE